MRIRSARRARRGAGLACLALLASAPATAAELYLAGDIGISWQEGEGDGRNDVVGLSNSGTSQDSSPVYGSALGVQFPLDRALPWRARMPGFRVPYWPGRSLRFRGDEGFGFPDWDVRFEVEHLRGRDVDLATDSFSPQEPYRADVESWSVMGKLRLDIPVRRPIHAIAGRVPFLDPLTLYLGGGAGLGSTDVDASTGLLFGSESRDGLAWQAIAGFGYQLNDRVRWSAGWRYTDLGSVDVKLIDATGTPRGRYDVELGAHEFTTSLSFAFWRFSLRGRE